MSERLRRAGLVKLMAAAIRDHPAAEHGATEAAGALSVISARNAAGVG